MLGAYLLRSILFSLSRTVAEHIGGPSPGGVSRAAAWRSSLLQSQRRGQEWRLRASLDALRIVARQLPPAVVPGPRRIDAELIARVMALRPEAGRSHPAGKLRAIRALTSKRAQFVEMRQRLLAQIKAHEKRASAGLFTDMDLKALLEPKISELEERIEQAVAADGTLVETAGTLRSIPGVGPVVSAMLIAEMPKLGAKSAEQPQP
ncbi:hypothetical protein KO516_06910 [Citreicella sp. C3M06]|uniref:hypothetical protein n=1 Tax=Citreicella sp. C3M06 TaxID=2841564 RepID=UPI001C0A3617|nr:hypothetical protein [Citreicella sp. C3M06]MBU2960547.1 hypothetical protein [Citreicella sp. C3M06]